MRALIVGSEGARGSIAAARALTRSGWIVGVGVPEHGPVTGSRAVNRTHRIPPPQDLKAFVKAVNSAIITGGYEVVFGGGDAEVLALSYMRKNVRAKVPYPSHDRVVEALDKTRLMRAAQAAGLQVPSVIEASEEGLRAATYPVMVKAGMHWSPERSSAPPRIEAQEARSPEEAIALTTLLREQGAEVLVQEMVTGDLLAVTALVDGDGNIVASVQQRADRVWPPRRGVSVRAESEAQDEQLQVSVAKLLAQLEWFGIAQLQFIATDDGNNYLIDLNGRFYGSLALAVGAGCDLPTAWANLATGRPVAIEEARRGVRYQWLEGDLRRALEERRGGRWADVRSCFSYSRGAIHSVWSARDPGPGLSYISSLTARAARRAFR